MELKALKCPNCGAKLEVEDGLDTFFCKYCGNKIILEGQSEAAYKAKVNAKKIEKDERIENKKMDLKLFKAKEDAKDNKRATILGGIIVFFFLLPGILFVFFIFGMPAIRSYQEDKEMKQQEAHLQQIVNEVSTDIYNKDFANAYIKASQIKFENGGEEKTNKWEETRKNVVAQIEAAEKAETGKSTNPDRKWYQKIFDWN